MRGRYFNRRYNFQYAWQQDQSKPTEVCNAQKCQRSGWGPQPIYRHLAGDSRIMHKVNPLAKGNITPFSGLGFLSPPSTPLTPKMVWSFITRNSGSTSIKGLKNKAPDEPKETISYPSVSFLFSFLFSQKSVRQTPEKVSI